MSQTLHCVCGEAFQSLEGWRAQAVYEDMPDGQVLHHSLLRPCSFADDKLSDFEQGRLAGRKEMAEAVMKQCSLCSGAGEYESSCSRCEDSTEDHACEYETLSCLRCARIRNLVEKEPGDE